MPPEGSFHFKCLLKSCIDESSLPRVKPALALHGHEWMEGLISYLNCSLGCCELGIWLLRLQTVWEKWREINITFLVLFILLSIKPGVEFSQSQKTLGVCFWQFAELLNGMHEFQKCSASEHLEFWPFWTPLTALHHGTFGPVALAFSGLGIELHVLFTFKDTIKWLGF